MKFKYIRGMDYNPYRNLAIEQELMKYVANDTAILYLWQNHNAIVVGRNQDIYSECKVDEFLHEGGCVVRRRSGGGAVYHDLGNLNFSIICNTAEQRDCTYQSILQDVIGQFGIKTEYNGRNDILVLGKKCSGNAVYQEGEVMCQHGTLLIASDIKKMMDFLTPDKCKLARNQVASVSSRVMNLSEANKNINVEKMINAFLNVTNATELKVQLDEERIADVTKFYKSWKWIYGGRR